MNDLKRLFALCDEQPALTTAEVWAWKVAIDNRYFDDAEEEAFEAVDCLLKMTQAPLHCAIAYWSRGNLGYFSADFAASLTDYRQAEQILNTLGDDLRWARMATGMVGVLSEMGGRVAEAEAVVARAAPLLAATGEFLDARRRAGMFENLGGAYLDSGRLLDALSCSEQKIAFWRDHPTHPESPYEIARSQINLGFAKLEMSLWAEAERDLTAAVEALANRERYRRDYRRGLHHLIYLRMLRGDGFDGIDAQLREVGERLDDEATTDNLAFRVKVARWLVEGERVTQQELERFSELETFCREVGKGREAVQFTILRGHAARQIGHFAEAAQLLERARMDAAENVTLLAESGYQLGLLFAQQNEPQAERVWRETVEQIERVAQGVDSADLRQGFLHSWQRLYRSLARLALQNGDREQAWHWVERLRGREMAGLFSAETLPQQLTEKRSQLAQLAPDAPNRPKIEAELIALQRQLAPHGTAWTDVATLQQIAAALPAGTLLLTYATLPSEFSYSATQELWVVPLTHEGVQEPVCLGEGLDSAEIDRHLRDLQNVATLPSLKMLSAQSRRQLLALDQQILTHWFGRLLAPIYPIIAQHKHLLIVPDAEMLRLPFHAFYNGQYLHETHTVAYTSSATAWHAAQQKSAAQVGGVVFAYDTGNLTHTVESAREIGTLFPDFVRYEQAEATTEKLTTAQQTRYLHFATHAEFRADAPAFSYIELADRKLRAMDIVRLRLNAELVVLSACDTGRGYWLGGAWLGLTRAFLLAGAKTVLVTHWPVLDRPTAQFMQLFYQQLAAGFSPSEALRRAQQQFSNGDMAFPYFWGGFFLFEG